MVTIERLKQTIYLPDTDYVIQEMDYDALGKSIRRLGFERRKAFAEKLADDDLGTRVMRRIKIFYPDKAERMMRRMIISR